MSTPKTFTKQSISTTSDQDALQIKDVTGAVLGWIDATGTGQGNLASGGGGGSAFVPVIQSVSSSTSLSYDSSFSEIAVMATGGNTAPGITLTLPTAASHGGYVFSIKREDSGSYNSPVIVATTGGQTIEGQTTVSLWHQWDELQVISNGSNWRMLSAKGGPVNNAGGGVNEIDTTVAHDSTYPVASGAVIKATYTNGSPFVDSGVFGDVIAAKTLGTGALFNVTGQTIDAIHGSSGNATQVTGAQFSGNNTSTGTVTLARGFTTSVTNTGGGTITEARGIDISSNTLNAGVSKYIGANIANHVYTSAGVNSWGIVVGNGTRAVALGGSTGPTINAGAGSPESSLTAPVGSIYMRTDGGAGTSLYVKESGSSNTGWVGK